MAMTDPVADLLTRIRNVIRENLDCGFPLKEITNRFKNDPTKNYAFDDDFIEEIIISPYGSNEAYYLLATIYPDLDYYNQDFLYIRGI